MSYSVHEIQDAIDSLNEFITQNTAAFTTAVLMPANIKTALAAPSAVG